MKNNLCQLQCFKKQYLVVIGKFAVWLSLICSVSNVSAKDLPAPLSSEKSATASTQIIDVEATAQGLASICELILSGELRKAGDGLIRFQTLMDIYPSSNREHEIKAAQKTGIVTALHLIVEDAIENPIFNEQCRVTAQSILHMLNGLYPKAIKQAMSGINASWKNVPADLKKNLLNASRSYTDMCETWEQIGRKVETLNIKLPHHSLLFVFEHARAMQELNSGAVSDSPNLPKLSRGYINYVGDKKDRHTRFPLLSFLLFDKALIELQKAPSLSPDTKKRKRIVDVMTIPERNSPRFDAYLNIYQNLSTARTRYHISERFSAICLRLGIEAGNEVLKNWKIDGVIFISGSGWLNRTKFRHVLSQDKKALDAIGVSLSGPAGFGMGMLHGLTSPLRLFEIFDLEFAYPKGVAAWPLDYTFGVIVGGFIMCFMISSAIAVAKG